MKFSIEQSDIDFAYTSIDNIFIEDYMPIANGDYVKVYLYAYKQISQDKDMKLNNEIIAKNLQLTITDVQNAWKYWASEGIVEIKEDLDDQILVEFKDLKKIYVNARLDINIPKKSKTESLVTIFTSNEEIRQMFGNIDYFMRRQTSPTEKVEIISWISDYNMSRELIETAFQYATEKKKRVSVNYVKAIIKSWYDNGLDTREKVEEELKNSDYKYVRKNKVLRKMGLEYRNVSDAEIDLINKWYDDYNFSEEVIDEALKRTANVSRPSINYADAILKNWHDLGIETVEDIGRLDIKPTKKRPNRKTGFHNFQGQGDKHSVDELDQIAKELMEKRSGK